MIKARIIIIFVIVLLLGALCSGDFLVVDEPHKAEVILVLAGETNRRPERGLKLYRQGYSSKVIIDVPANERVYSWAEVDLAKKYIGGLPEAESLRICTIYGLSTQDEARDTASCLQAVGAREVLIVTSDFHTRRALSIFRKQIPGCHFYVAAAYDPVQFGTQWWGSG